MTPRLLLLTVALTLLAVLPACAQPQSIPPADATVASPDSLTETERQVQALLAEPGIYVVHFWAPWCHNSRSEFQAGVWNEVIAAHDDVTFIFVTVYNDGDLGARVLDRYDIPERVHRFAQPDDGPSSVRANRRRAFLGLPLTWTPTTWIFNRRGKLAYAINYGEARPSLMQTLLDDVRNNWSH